MKQRYIYCQICKTEHPVEAFQLTGAGWEPKPPGEILEWTRLKCNFTAQEFRVERTRKVAEPTNLLAPYADRDEAHF